MKTRRNHGSKQRMTVNSDAISTHNTSGKNDQTTLDSTDGTTHKESTIFHETRSQKLTKVNGLQEDHAETKEPSPHHPELSSSNVRVSTRSSTRPQKRQRKSITPPRQDTQTTGPSKVKKKRTGKKNKKRQWESWSQEDKNAFFDALHEHGKDFDKIQVILQTKHKRRGDPKNVIKNKDQVRHFYYRTLNKISKYVPKDKQFTTETDPHQKTVLELRSLTCFGELRKRVGGLGEKQGKKLHELLEYGWTTIRQSGRNARLKAPVCRALKKLTSTDAVGKCDESSNLPPPVPSKLDVEFIPVDNSTWLAVQGLSKNPRLKTTVSSKKPLSVVITFLTKKWPVKSSKPNSSGFLALCIAVPIEFLLPKDPPQQKESMCSSESQDLNKNTCDANDIDNRLKDDTIEPDVQNSPNTDLLHSTNQPLQSTTADNTSNSSQSIVKDGKSVAGSTDISNDERKLWTATNCGNITIGEIYCKLQRPTKLKFEYLFQQDDTELSSEQHGHSALQKLVDIAKTEFLLSKKCTASKSAANNSDANRMPAPAGKTLRIAPKHPFILPSIFQPAPRQVYSQPSYTPLPSTRTSTSFALSRKRTKKSHQSSTVLQRKLLPHPAMPRGTVAVSFIPQPISPVSSPGLCPVNDGVERPLSPAVSPKSVNQVSSSNSSAIVDNTPSPASPLTPAASPVPSNSVITTVLETGIQQQPSASDPGIQQETICSDINNIPCISNPVVSLPEVDQLIDTLQNLTPTTCSPTGLNDIATVTSSLQLDPVVSMNEDSSSELLASIMGLNTLTSSQTATLSTATDSRSFPQNSTNEGHIQELSTGIAGCPAVSFPSTSLIDIPSPSNTETVLSVGTCPATTAGVFFNPGSDRDVFTVNTSEKACLSPTGVHSSLFTSPQSSPGCITSPTSEPQWFNGEVSDISLSFLEKMTVSPEKEPRFGFDTPNVPLFTVGKDSMSQDSLFGSKPVTETAQAERAFRAIMDENSVDFVKKFQDLTKQLSVDDKSFLGGGENSSDSCSSGILSFRNLLNKSGNTSD